MTFHRKPSEYVIDHSRKRSGRVIPVYVGKVNSRQKSKQEANPELRILNQFHRTVEANGIGY